MKRENLTFEYVNIPCDVHKRISTELNSIGYESAYVLRKSLHPKDKNLYVVIAKKKNSYAPYYSFWSCYNDATITLNHGHYGYDDWNKCFDAALEYVSEGGTTMNETTENIKKIDKLCKGIKRRFEVIEGNAGDLYLVVFAENGQIDYMKEEYEYQKGSLMDDLKTISEGFTPVDHGQIDFVTSPEDTYSNMMECGNTSVIADNNGFYPLKCGSSACREFEIKKGEIEFEYANETKKSMYILVTVCDREILVEKFDTYEKAYHEMESAFNNLDQRAVSVSEINAWYAWANTDDYNFDWKIFELE